MGKAHYCKSNLCHYCDKTFVCWEILGETLYYRICRKHKKLRLADGFKKCICGEIYHPPQYLEKSGMCKVCHATQQLGGKNEKH